MLAHISGCFPFPLSSTLSSSLHFPQLLTAFVGLSATSPGLRISVFAPSLCSCSDALIPSRCTLSDPVVAHIAGAVPRLLPPASYVLFFVRCLGLVLLRLWRGVGPVLPHASPSGLPFPPPQLPPLRLDRPHLGFASSFWSYSAVACAWYVFVSCFFGSNRFALLCAWGRRIYVSVLPVLCSVCLFFPSPAELVSVIIRGCLHRYCTTSARLTWHRAAFGLGDSPVFSPSFGVSGSVLPCWFVFST